MPRLHRWNGYPEQPGGIGDADSLTCRAAQCRLVFLRQLCDGFSQQAIGLHSFQPLERRGGFLGNLEPGERRLIQRNQSRRPPQAVPLKHLMNRYLNEPRAETSLALKLPQVQERFQQRLLNHIFGVRAVFHFGVHHSLQRRQVRFEQVIE